jgi:septal ring factor EnvC (AmiA/AmiB activator)
MRWLPAASLIALLLPLAASAPAQPQSEPLEAQLRQARDEQRTAEAEAAKLERAAVQARGTAAKLHARQLAAAKAIESAEARITAAETQWRLVSAYLDQRRRRLARQEQPVSALLAGLVVMGQRPPLLAFADRGGTDELVKVRVLLDSTLPAIRARTAALSAEIAQGERLRQNAADARTELAHSREALTARKDAFAALERQATQSALLAKGRAVAVGDVALAAGEDIERLRGGAGDRARAAALARALAAAEPAPPRPFAAEGGRAAPPLDYRLPATADVIDGLGSVSPSGVQSRGITLATRRGAPVIAPAAGVVRFSGPFRDYDGIVILDHGGGWMSLILNLASPLEPGARVAAGDSLGRALGPLGVELSQNGRRVSPALIAGSSQTLSKRSKGG